MENAVTKALKQAGFPELEGKFNPSAHSNKVMGALQKRIMKLSDLWEQANAIQPPSELVTKMLPLCLIINDFLFSSTVKFS